MLASLGPSDADRPKILDYTYEMFLGWRRMCERSKEVGTCSVPRTPGGTCRAQSDGQVCLGIRSYLLTLQTQNSLPAHLLRGRRWIPKASEVGIFGASLGTQRPPTRKTETCFPEVLRAEGETCWL